MLKWFKSAQSSTVVSIYLTQTALYAVEEQYPRQVIELLFNQGESAASALVRLIGQQQWQGRRIKLALGRHFYRQTQIDKPAMPDDELAQALPWCMREMVDEPVEQLLFDYIDLPTGPQGTARIAVYYSKRQPLAELVAAITPLCSIATMGPDELAMCNLLAADQRGLVLHKVPGQELTMTFIHQGQWHFSRTIRGFQALDDESMAVDQFVFDNLLLELQRSIDYATGQLKLNAPNQWFLALPQRVTPAVQLAIKQVFDIEAESLTNEHLSPVSLPAIGMLEEDKA
ncbi:MSHA biogenesis protein MshI [Oceanimonas sp. AH20CE76]|uniref:MSHA biogenesis protein MshI n=1 Tax=unclassified Oceanimonas TaxID=2636315 RepID=UPI002936BF39|nr:MSHA biogenesis protein MshI [Oceanimonas sp. CAM02]MDV2858620.1 MSHA biogenesis protein MshI [Oceanimonas sp. CAM02]